MYGPVKIKGEKAMHEARPDYGIWYRMDRVLCLNVLIVEAKRSDFESGVALALAV
jgi:hypothetical protein